MKRTAWYYFFNPLRAVLSAVLGAYILTFRHLTSGCRHYLRRVGARPSFVLVMVVSFGAYSLIFCYAVSVHYNVPRRDAAGEPSEKRRDGSVLRSYQDSQHTKNLAMTMTEAPKPKVTAVAVARPKISGTLPDMAEEEGSETLDLGNKSSVLLAGTPRSHKVYVAIGLVTVERAEDMYYFTTIDSLLKESAAEEQAHMTIVTMLGDRNQSYNNAVLRKLHRNYQQHLDSGLLLVIKRPDTEYLFSRSPSKQTYGDSVERVQWRSKQNLDYAALMEFSYGLSKYYLQLEDDVLAGKQYVFRMRQFIHNQRNVSWVRLDFSVHGFIGKLFPCEELHKLVTLLRTFYLEQPCDFILNYFHALLTQPKIILHRGKLFFHLGRHSSLSNVTRKTDRPPAGRARYPDVGKKVKEHVNPEASVVTSMSIYGEHYPEYAYNPQTAQYFWAEHVRKGDYITVVFHKPQNVKELIVETGFADKNERDRAERARVEVGQTANLPGQFDDPPDKEHPICTDTKVVAHFVGRFQGPLSKAENGIQCISLVVEHDQKQWLVIREIVVNV